MIVTVTLDQLWLNAQTCPMDAEQGRLTQRGAALMAAVFRADEVGFEVLAEEAKREPRFPEALLAVGMVAASTWCVATGRPDTSIGQMWPHLPPPGPDLADLVDRDGVTDLASATRVGGDGLEAARERLAPDTRVFQASAFDLAVATLQLLEQQTGVPAADWCAAWATATAGGIGIE